MEKVLSSAQQFDLKPSSDVRLFEALLGLEFNCLFQHSSITGAQSGWYGHVPFAQWIVEAARPCNLIELGTHSGVSYAALCDAVLRASLATRCYAVDTWHGDAHAGFYGEEVFENFNAFHSQRYAHFSALLRMTFDDALAYFPDGSIDLLHIDGFHSYEGVRHDFENWRPKLSNRAIVLLHDTNVRDREFGVWKLWAELRASYRGFEFLHGHGLGVLQVGDVALPPVAALCALQDQEQICLIRERFAMAGQRCILESEAIEHKGALARIAAELDEVQKQRDALQRDIARLVAKHEATLANQAADLAATKAAERRLVDLVAKHEATLANQAADLATTKAAERHGETKRQELNDRVRDLRQQLEQITGSTTWKATWPVRAAGAQLPSSARSAVRVGLQACWRALTPWLAPARHQVRDLATLAGIPVLPRDLSLAAKWCDPCNPDVSIVVLNWNLSTMTLNCLQYIWSHTTGHSYEVIIVDNGSRDEELRLLEADAGPAQVLRLGCNRYFGDANNIGVEAARGRYICLLNNDAFVQHGWLGPLVELLEQTSDAGAVGPKFVFPDGRLQEAGALVSLDGTVTQLGRFGDPMAPSLNIIREVDYVSAATVLLRREDFLAVLGFDLCWDPAYYEDVDLCLKLRLLGLKTLYCPQSTVVHIENATSNSDEGRSLKLNNIVEINRGKFVRRWQRYLAGDADAAPRLLPGEATIRSVPSEWRPRIALFTPYNLVPGGGERHLLSIAEALRDTHEVCVVTQNPFSRTRVLTMGRELGLRLEELQLRTLDDCRKEPQFDLCFSVGNEIFPHSAGLGRRNVFICQFPFPLEPGEHVARMRSYWEDYDLVLVYSKYVRDHVLRLMEAEGLPRRPIEILHPPVQLFTPDMTKKKARILHVGRFFTSGHCKLQHKLVEGFRLLLAGPNPVQVELHLAGAIHSEPEHRAYYTQVEQAARDLPVQLHPNCSPEDLARLYETSSVYWHATGLGTDVEAEPHKSEHFGISIVEAMSAGCIPVVYAAGGPAEVVVHGRTGFHFRTLEELCQLTQPLVRAPHATRAQAMGLAAAEAAQAYSDHIFHATIREIVARLTQEHMTIAAK
jgi:GT2 family glycosyltransferase/glycosyltransferase involved in cell wall biosynthesis